MGNLLKVCAVPHEIIQGDKHANTIAIAARLRQVEPDTDLVVLPELFTTGYIFDKQQLKELAETDDGHTPDTLRRWAAFFGFAIAGSYLATDGEGRFYNRGFIVEPAGDTTFYDKRHLFTLSNEAEVYTPGHKLPPIVRYRGWDIKLIICFDLRFPVWIRNTPQRRFDLLICPSMWGGSRAGQFKYLLGARAIENQAYAMSCNRLGEDKYGKYPTGMSWIFDNLGNEIQETRRNGLIYSLLDLEILREGRRRFPAFESTDNFTIEL